MELQEKELLEKLMLENSELKELIAKHADYEAQLEEMNQRPYLSPEDDLERKRIQKAKLAGKDRIQSILEEHAHK